VYMKLRHRAASAAFAYLLSVAPSFATTVSAPSVVRDYGSWLPITTKIPLWRKWFLYSELQPTFQQSHHPVFSEMQIRPGLGRQLNSHWAVLAGCFWSPHFDQKIDNERMVWEQVSYSRKFEAITFQNRFRPEEVWHSTYRGPETRIRNMVKVTYDIGASPYYIAVSEEPFYNLNSIKKGPVSGFAENRLFVGIGRKINWCTRLEAGYMNQYKNSRTNAPDKSNHLLVVNLSLDFTAKKPVPKNYKLAKNGADVVASVPQVVMSDFYTPMTVMFSGYETVASTGYHPALAGLARTRSL
jgi:hypothetical protein